MGSCVQKEKKPTIVHQQSNKRISSILMTIEQVENLKSNFLNQPDTQYRLPSKGREEHGTLIVFNDKVVFEGIKALKNSKSG